jgi:hypothetical protein
MSAAQQARAWREEWITEQKGEEDDHEWSGGFSQALATHLKVEPHPHWSMPR